MTVKAIYEDGVFKPREPIHLEEHTEVEVVIAAATGCDADDPTGWNAVEALIGFIDDAPAEMAEHHDSWVGNAMDIHLEIPEEFARHLASDPKGLARVAVEALAAEGVRSGKLTTFQACSLLGSRSRYEMDSLLKAHGVFLDLTWEDVQKDTAAALASAR